MDPMDRSSTTNFANFPIYNIYLLQTITIMIFIGDYSCNKPTNSNLQLYILLY